MATLISFPLPEPYEGQQSEMKLRPEDKQWLAKEIADQVKSGVATAVDSFRPHGFRRATSWAREWGPSALFVSVPLVLLGMLITVSIFAAKELQDNTKFQTRTEDRLDHIESVMLTLQASDSPGKVLKDLSALPPKQFAQSLPALHKVTEQTAKVATTPAVLQKVSEQLQSVSSNTDDYWPTVLRFIQFSSARLASNAPPEGSPVNVFYTNVSGIRPPEGGTYQLKGMIANMTFVNSRIILTETPVFFQNARFIDCAFDLPAIENPPVYLRQTGRQLLASGITSGTLNTGM